MHGMGVVAWAWHGRGMGVGVGRFTSLAIFGGAKKLTSNLETGRSTEPSILLPKVDIVIQHRAPNKTLPDLEPEAQAEREIRIVNMEEAIRASFTMMLPSKGASRVRTLAQAAYQSSRAFLPMP